MELGRCSFTVPETINQAPIILDICAILDTIADYYDVVNPNMKKESRQISDADTLLFHHLTGIHLGLSEWSSSWQTRFPQVPIPSLGAFGTSRQSVLSIIGKRCPILAELRIRTIDCFTKQDIIRLLLGDMADALFCYNNDYGLSWDAVDSILEVLRVPSDFLSPLCFTLEKFFLECDQKHGYSNNNCGCFDGVSHSAFAFAFRYLPMLQQFNDSTRTRKAQVLKILHKTQSVDLGIQQLKFEEVCKKFATSIDGFQRNLVPSIPSGKLVYSLS